MFLFKIGFKKGNICFFSRSSHTNTTEDWEEIICISFRFYFWMIQWSSFVIHSLWSKTVLLIAKSAAWLYCSDQGQETKNKAHIIWNVSFRGFVISFKCWYFPAHMNLGTSLFMATAQTDLVDWQRPISTIWLETTLLKIEAWIFAMWLFHGPSFVPHLGWHNIGMGSAQV